MKKCRQTLDRKRAARLRMLRSARSSMLATGRAIWPAQIRREQRSAAQVARTTRAWSTRAKRWQMPGLVRLAKQLGRM
ncbi:hypothetical protein [Rhizobium tumorigenes]|uniref:hypothetical protein n=1 Tax=Rhizobium tumorigenes TaxID=2041385 RepID=UPI0024200F2B|nr:hypothetical protein [Rhizobium tumorigenes]WFS01623.1 hypothetical protein PR016_03020 [Rhizobium tumorigenes]WFS02199.1 hypothetical protein PR016_06190 [Rhizobium tumorigenes]